LPNSTTDGALAGLAERLGAIQYDDQAACGIC
jgi:hypothetical protein